MERLLKTRPPMDSEQLVRALVFYNNGFHLPKEVVFGAPKHYAPLEGDPNQSDTSVRVSMPQGCYRGDMGHKWLHYRRLDFGQLVSPNPGGILLPPGAFSLVSILPKINALYGINLAAEDIVDATYTAGQGPATMQAYPTSLAWQGQINLPISLDLASVTPDTGLAGFDPAAMVADVDLSGFTPVN